MKKIIASTVLATALALNAASAFAATGFLKATGESYYSMRHQTWVVECKYEDLYGSYWVTLRGHYCPYTYNS